MGASEGHLGTSPRGGLEGHSEGHIWVNLRSYLRVISEKPHETLRLAFIWPWVGLSLKNRLNIGSWDGPGWVPGIALPSTHPVPIPWVHPLPAAPSMDRCTLCRAACTQD